jgi:hypothetical protein
MAVAEKSRCEQNPGMCCKDPACPDKHCPGRMEAHLHRVMSMPIEPALVAAPVQPAPLLPAPIRYVAGYLSVYLRWWDHAAAKRNGQLASRTIPKARS